MPDHREYGPSGDGVWSRRCLLAGRYSPCASCEAAGVSPTDYLTHMLVRIQTHARNDIYALLPHRWAAARA